METESKPKYIDEILKMPLWTFIISFSIGTILLLLFLIDKNNSNVLITGFLYVLLAIPINFALLLFLIVCAIVHKECRKQILERTAVMLLNVPIAILYFFIVTGI